jgi:hypothetical protein
LPTLSASADEFHTSATLNAIHNCSKFESRLLADAISEKLPREIWDVIHSLCWEEKLSQYDHYKNERPWRASDVTEDELNGFEAECSEYCFPPHPRGKALRPFPVHHFFHPAYVGDKAAREAAEAFYRMAPAFVETLDPAQLANYFNYDDNFEGGIMPRDYVTSVIFFLDTYLAQLAGPWNLQITELPDLCLDEEGMKAIFCTYSR